MKHLSRIHILTASLCVIALSIFSASASFGALNSYLKLKGANGKSYIARPDESGNFSFSNVEPGKYKLLYVGDPAIFESAIQKGKERTIEIQSFSWGATNSGSMSGAGSAGKEGSIPSVSEAMPPTKPSASKGVQVQTGDLNGDGKSDLTAITSPKLVPFSRPKVEGNEYYTVVLDNIIVSSVCSPSGKVSGWNLKENVK